MGIPMQVCGIASRGALHTRFFPPGFRFPKTHTDTHVCTNAKRQLSTHRAPPLKFSSRAFRRNSIRCLEDGNATYVGPPTVAQAPVEECHKGWPNLAFPIEASSRQSDVRGSKLGHVRKLNGLLSERPTSLRTAQGCERNLLHCQVYTTQI